MTWKGSKYLSKNVADRNTVKWLTCCNILGSRFPSGIKVSFENIVNEILSDYSNLEDHNCMCVVVYNCLKVFVSAQETRCSLTKFVEMSWLLYKTNRFHFAVGLYSDNAQRTSKRGKNISHTSRLRIVAYFFVLTTFWRHLCVIRVQTHGKMESICKVIDYKSQWSDLHAVIFWGQDFLLE